MASTGGQGTEHGVRRRRRLALTLILTAVIAVAATLIALALLVPGAALLMPWAASSASGAPTSAAAMPSPSPTPSTPAEALLATATDPNACAVSFAGTGITMGPQLQTEGKLYQYLPIPQRPRAVFAGWYPSRQAAAAAQTSMRVNGADVVTCTDRQITLYAAWTTPAAVAAANVGVPILMYHLFTAKPGGEHNWLRLDYVSTGNFDAQMAYLASKHFYLPTWDELNAFIDGKLALPHNAVIITDDDADASWFQLGVPIIDKYKLLSTSFVITKDRSAPSPSTYVLQRSHTNAMHDAGANGRGKMVNFTAAQVAADMETSARILGVKEVMAYPFGDYNDTAKQGLREAGFEMARTTHYGYVRAGTDKLALPCVRISFDTTLDQFVRDVS